jgi:hypothetical protein
MIQQRGKSSDHNLSWALRQIGAGWSFSSATVVLACVALQLFVLQKMLVVSSFVVWFATYTEASVG